MPSLLLKSRIDLETASLAMSSPKAADQELAIALRFFVES